MKKLICVFAALMLFLAGCGATVPELPVESHKQTDNTAPSTEAAAPRFSYANTKWEADYVTDKDGVKTEIADLIENGSLFTSYEIRFLGNGHVNVDDLDLHGYRGVWEVYTYSDEQGLSIDFDPDGGRPYTLVAASAESIEIQNELGETFHFVPVS